MTPPWLLALPDAALAVVQGFLPAVDLLLHWPLACHRAYLAVRKDRVACRRLVNVPLQNVLKPEWWYTFLAVEDGPPHHCFDITRFGYPASTLRILKAEDVSGAFAAWREGAATAPRPPARMELPYSVAIDRKALSNDVKEIETSLVSMFALSTAAFAQASRSAKTGGARVTYRGLLRRGTCDGPMVRS